MTTSILLYILIGAIVILIGWIGLLEHRLKKFFSGTRAKNFEEVFMTLSKEIAETRNTQKEINAHLTTVDSRLNKSIRKVETIRFNPFMDAGSNQSFAIALLNDEKDGLILSSLYARDRMSIFAKPIVGGKSEFELSVEEKDVLNKAM